MVKWLIASTSAAAVIACVVVFAGQSPVAAPGDRSVSQSTPAAMEILPSETFDVIAADLIQSISVSGSLAPSRRLDISAQVSGLVETVSVRTGDRVDEGAQLLAIDVEDIRLQVKQQRATLSGIAARHAAALASLERTQQLAERGLASQSELQSAQSEAASLASDTASLQAQLEQAEANLRRSVLTAPFAGTVAIRAVEPGQSIAPGTTLITLVDQSDMVAEVTVPLADSAKIIVGQAVELTVRGMDGQVFPASVDRINPVAEDGTRSVKVFLTLPNLDGLLRGGMFVAGEIRIATAHQVIAVPESAVMEAGGESYVMTLRDGLAQQRAVVVERLWTDAGLVEITGGLDVGDRVLTARLPQVEDGSPVQLLGAL